MTRFSAAAAALASLVLIIAASPPVFAAKLCDDNPLGNPKDGLRLLDEVEAFVPFVPPEQAAYFEKELGAAFKIHSHVVYIIMHGGCT